MAALAYGGATILQAVGVAALRTSAETSGHGKRRAALLYGSGLALDGVGFVAQAAAANQLPLFLVQAVTASSVAITALLAVVVLNSRLSRNEIIALVAVGLGLLALASTAAEGPPKAVPNGFALATLLAAAPAGLLLLLGWRTKNASVLAFAAGIGFSGVAIAARIIDWHNGIHLLSHFSLWALVMHGAVAMVGYALALDVGEATAVAAINFSTETLIPAAVGLGLLGDAVRPGWGPVTAVGFVLTLAGCIGLAQQSEPDANHAQAPTPS